MVYDCVNLFSDSKQSKTIYLHRPLLCAMNDSTGIENQIDNLKSKVNNGLFQNLSISQLGNSKVIILSPKVMDYLNLTVNSRVMVVPYD